MSDNVARGQRLKMFEEREKKVQKFQFDRSPIHTHNDFMIFIFFGFLRDLRFPFLSFLSSNGKFILAMKIKILLTEESGKRLSSLESELIPEAD